MSYYVIGSDVNNGHDNEYKQYLANRLTSEGHDVEIVANGPNVVQRYGNSNKSTGKIGVQIAGGLDGWTAADMVVGLGSYYHYDKMHIVGTSEFNGYTQTLSKASLDNYAMVRAHDAGASLQEMYVGKTPNEFNTEVAKYNLICLGDTFDEAIDMLLGTSSGEGAGDDKSNTFKDMILELISVWSSQILCYIVEDNIYIHKIIDPEEDNIWVQEGINIVHNSASVTDINPNTINTLKVNYGEGKSFKLVDNELLRRFGEVSAIITAVRYVAIDETKKKEKEKKEEEEKRKKKEKDSTDKHTDVRKEGVPESTKVQGLRIMDYDDALEYAKNKFYSIKSMDEHVLEVEVLGDNGFQVGKWCYIYLPSFNQSGYMFCNKISNDFRNGAWISKVSLIDGPSILSTPEVEEEEMELPQFEKKDKGNTKKKNKKGKGRGKKKDKNKSSGQRVNRKSTGRKEGNARAKRDARKRALGIK